MQSTMWVQTIWLLQHSHWYFTSFSLLISILRVRGIDILRTMIFYCRLITTLADCTQSYLSSSGPQHTLEQGSILVRKERLDICCCWYSSLAGTVFGIEGLKQRVDRSCLPSQQVDTSRFGVKNVHNDYLHHITLPHTPRLQIASRKRSSSEEFSLLKLGDEAHWEVLRLLYSHFTFLPLSFSLISLV